MQISEYNFDENSFGRTSVETLSVSMPNETSAFDAITAK